MDITGWITMTGGGSHRSNAKLRIALRVANIRYEEAAFGVSFGGDPRSKRRIFYVHPHDEAKARLLGMRRKR